MSKQQPLSIAPDLYPLSEAADLISDQVGQDHVQRERLAEDMRKAVHQGELGAYFYTDGEPLRKNAIGELVRKIGDDKFCKVELTTPLCVRPAGVNAWLKTTSYGFTWDAQAPASAFSERRPSGSPSKEPVKNGTVMRWTPEFKEEVRAYRADHTAKETAEYFDVSEALVRRKLSKPNKADSAKKSSPWTGLVRR